MKQKVTIEFELSAVRKDYYTDAGALKCSECVLYDVCCAMSKLVEQFPYSFVVNTPSPCRQGVLFPDRKYFKFKG